MVNWRRKHEAQNPPHGFAPDAARPRAISPMAKWIMQAVLLNREREKMVLQEIVKQLQLSPLKQEGGLYRQTWCSAHGTAIYYLLDGDSFSHFHRLAYDEVYHFYLGDPVCLWELYEDGRCGMTILGQNLTAGEQVQHVVPAGVWQGSCRIASFPGSGAPKGCGYALLGTTMAPGYTQECYSHGSRKDLIARWPEADAAICRLTTEDR